jgi:thiol:disulfide interchange protein DsbD
MAFVQQAGDSRVRVFMLNLWYCLGVMAVFMVLATLAVVFGMKWADQFTSATFNIVLTSVVFAFALSLLGVWEIPIPGFVGSGKAQEIAEKEGVTAAFLKGILATVLATPCAGPLVVPAIAWAVKQPPLIAYGGFACVGFGMASPYLVIGIFPRVISFLPKPGAWMETFKHIMGFILLGTVVWLLTFIPIPYVIPAVALIMGLWAAFWWIGRTPLTEPFLPKLRAWIGGAAFAAAIGLFAFGWLLNVMESRFQRAVDRELGTRNVATAAPAATGHGDEGSHELPWQPYSLALLEKVTGEGKTVFVDFTADW